MTTPIFPSLLQEDIFWAVFAATLLELAWLGKAQRPFRSKETLKRRQSEIAIYFTLLSIIVVPLVLGYARICVLPNWLFYPGIALFLVGNLFTLWSMDPSSGVSGLEKCECSLTPAWFKRVHID